MTIPTEMGTVQRGEPDNIVHMIPGKFSNLIPNTLLREYLIAI